MTFLLLILRYDKAEGRPRVNQRSRICFSDVIRIVFLVSDPDTRNDSHILSRLRGFDTFVTITRLCHVDAVVKINKLRNYLCSTLALSALMLNINFMSQRIRYTLNVNLHTLLRNLQFVDIRASSFTVSHDVSGFETNARPTIDFP